MARLFKSKTTTYVGPDGKRCKKDTPGAKRKVVKSRRWYIEYTDANGKRVSKAGYTDKGATAQKAAKLEKRVARRLEGMADPREDDAPRRLSEHLADFRDILKGRDRAASHVAHTVSRIAAVVEGVKAEFPADLDTAKVVRFLTSLREDGDPVGLPAERESFTPSEAAALLGVSRAALSATVVRYSLPATGKGKARRLPRESVEAAARIRVRGIGPATYNHYVRALRGFTRWMYKDGRVARNPLEWLDLLDRKQEQADVRHGRRELTPDEVRRLLTAARSGGRAFRGLDGEARYHLYLCGMGTGFRAGALASLTPESFDLRAVVPVVTLRAGANKSRKDRTQPVPAEIAEALAGYIDGRPAGLPVWPGTWAVDGAEMIRADLAVAGVAYRVSVKGADAFADLHSMRHSYITALHAAGLNTLTVMELAGHSSPAMTARYAHSHLRHLAGAVASLPSVVPPSPTPEGGHLFAGLFADSPRPSTPHDAPEAPRKAA